MVAARSRVCSSVPMRSMAARSSGAPCPSSRNVSRSATGLAAVVIDGAQGWTRRSSSRMPSSARRAPVLRLAPRRRVRRNARVEGNCRRWRSEKPYAAPQDARTRHGCPPTSVAGEPLRVANARSRLREGRQQCAMQRSGRRPQMPLRPPALDRRRRARAYPEAAWPSRRPTGPYRTGCGDESLGQAYTPLSRQDSDRRGRWRKIAGDAEGRPWLRRIGPASTNFDPARRKRWMVASR